MPEANSTILVIDDDPDVRASVGRLLRSLGMNVQLFAFRTCRYFLMCNREGDDDHRRRKKGNPAAG
jgi:FixJ family two-component response regulator